MFKNLVFPLASFYKKLVCVSIIFFSIVVSAQSPPTFTSTPITSVDDNQQYSYSIRTADENNDAVTVTGVNLPDWLSVGAGDPDVSTFVGTTEGYQDGAADVAQFNYPNGFEVDAQGNIYVSDAVNGLIRKITPSGVVSTFAGSGNGYADGSADVAKFSYPKGIVIDKDNNMYVADSGNNRIRKITPSGVVSTLAGSTYGFADGTGADAQFAFPVEIDIDVEGNLYVSDANNQRIRKITPDGVVTTFAGSGATGAADGTGTAAEFNTPFGICIDPAGNLYVTEGYGQKIRKISATGEVTTIAGAGVRGYAEGTGTEAQFNQPTGIAIDASGNLYVADVNNHRIRKITPAGVVTTFAGSTLGYVDGPGTTAKFDVPDAIAIDAAGNFYIGDVRNYKIRKITPGFVLTGNPAGHVGTHNITLEANDGSGGTVQQTFTITVNDVTAPIIITKNFMVELNEEGTATIKTEDIDNGSSDDSGTIELSLNKTTFDCFNLSVSQVIPALVPSLTQDTKSYGGGFNPNTNEFWYPQWSGTTVYRYDEKHNSLGSFDSGQNQMMQLWMDLDSKTDYYTANWGNNTITKRSGNTTLWMYNVGTTAACVSADEQYVYSLGWGQNKIVVLNKKTGVFVKEINLPGSIHSFGGLVIANESIYIGGHANGWSDNPSNYAYIHQLDMTGVYIGSTATERGVYSTAFDGETIWVSDNSSTINGVKITKGIAVTLTATDPSGNSSTSKAFVTVEDHIAPTIVLNGANSLSIEKGSVFIDDGATAKDNCASSIVRTGALDVYKTGVYTLNYKALDASKNESASVTRTVTVENIAPTFTSLPITSVDDDQKYSYSITTEDEDKDAIAITGLNLPDWLRVGPGDPDVSTFAGSTSGYQDGAADVAKFASLAGMVLDAAGNMFVADQSNQRIRKITPAGVVSTFAGSTQGYIDGIGTDAKFYNPSAIAIDAEDNIYVSDWNNHKIRKVTPAGVVSTLAGSTLGYADGAGAAAQFNYPGGLDVDADGNVYVADVNNQRIRKITPDGVVTTFAGSGTWGSADGDSNSAQFQAPYGLTVDATANVYVAGSFGHNIRKISPLGEVTTIAGSGVPGLAEGSGANAQFNQPRNIVIDAIGNLYVADANNHRIRKITPSGVVTTFAGTTAGYADGPGTTAKFKDPESIAIDAAGNFYVGDRNNYKIRKITPNFVLTGNPAGKAGIHTVTLEANDGSGGTAQQTFTITVNDRTPPTITSFSPLTGDVGATVTITGTNFNSTAANNIVFFGATRATVTAATTTSLKVTVPVGANFAPVSVVNGERALIAYSSNNFNPTFTPTKGSITPKDFDAKVDFTVGNNPGGVSIGDIDGDGRSDLIVSNFSDNKFSVLRNSGGVGNISFEPKIDFPVSGQPKNVAIGDIDGDGKLDLVASNHLGSGVTIYLNTSTPGTVSFASRIDVITSTMTYWVELSDIDRDGKLDLVYALGRENFVGIQRNTSSVGSVSFGAEKHFSSSNGTVNLAVGDIDGDGKPDIAVTAMNISKVSLLRNTTIGSNITFEAQVLYDIPNRSSQIKFADMDGDGKLDLIANPNIFRNTSVPGSFSFAPVLAFPEGGFFDIGDIDGDGKPDFTQSATRYLTASVRRNISTIGSLAFEDAADFAGNSYPNGISLGDLDGDGKTDIAISNYSNQTVSVIRSNPKSSNADLLELTTTAGTLDPTFATETTRYNASVNNATKSITVTPTQVEANATMQARVNEGVYIDVTTATTSGSLDLEEGSNTVEVAVTAQDGTTIIVYTIEVIRGLSNVITNFNDTTKKYFDGSYTITAPTSNSTGAFTYTSGNTAVATIDGAVVTFQGIGDAIITVTQAGDDRYNSGSTTATLTVNSVSVLTINGEISTTNPSYVNKYGAVNTDMALDRHGKEVIAKTPPPPAIDLVTIGTQTWTVKNLDVATYSDGTAIPEVTDAGAWAALKTGAWCYYTGTDGTTYGKLYNWYAVVGIYDAASSNDPSLRKQLAPSGWHVPSEEEWNTLTAFLGGNSGGKMKETGLAHWRSPNTAATNSSGFTALPGGYRESDGTFYSIGTNGDWWSSTEDDFLFAWIRNLTYNSGNASRGGGNKSFGFSVRCLRD